MKDVLNGKCETGDFTSSIQILADFLIENRSNFVVDSTGGICINLIKSRHAFEVKINHENLAGILTDITAMLATGLGRRTLSDKVKTILFDRNKLSHEQKEKREIAQLEEEFNALVFTEHKNLQILSDRFFESEKQCLETIYEIENDIRQNRQNIAENEKYTGKYQDKKTDFEKRNVEFERSIKEIREYLRKNKDLSDYALKNLKAVTHDFQELLKTDTLDRARKFLGNLKGTLQGYSDSKLEPFNKMLKDLQALKVQSLGILEEQAALEKLSGKEAESLKGKGKGKQKGKGYKKKGPKAHSKPKASESASTASERSKKVETGSPLKEREEGPLKVSATSEFMSQIQLMQEVFNDYGRTLSLEQKQKSEELKQRMDIQRQQNKRLFPLPEALVKHFGRRQVETTLDEKAQLSSQLRVIEQERETTKDLDVKISSEGERSLEPWFLRAVLAQRMEALKNRHGDLFPVEVAEKVRDILCYSSGLLNFSSESLRRTNLNIKAFLKAKKCVFKSFPELLAAVDPSVSPLGGLGNLAKFVNMTVPTITDSFCKERIIEGIKLWKQCHDLYVKSQGRCNKRLLTKVMGFAIGIIGNFASHLRKDEGLQVPIGELNRFLENMKGQAQVILPLDIGGCIELGKKFRHIDEMRKGDAVETADKGWKLEIDNLMHVWDKELPVKYCAGSQGTEKSELRAEAPAFVPKADSLVLHTATDAALTSASAHASRDIQATYPIIDPSLTTSPVSPSSGTDPQTLLAFTALRLRQGVSSSSTPVAHVHNVCALKGLGKASDKALP